ncbi:tannase and feruloyl esterase family protein (plasmid) [Rhizobium leguminosarum bv. viciae]|nr:tannase/feruloyl esterase family alpha/beta hydrolase [Rhizobium leguminosarum]AOO92170.1 hypothetical protein [Rhizobium leguminosarum bv. trifolii]AVC47354.1 tannase and feruloyl esterase family protein [Rhizobium leguminosarum bv. viciae]
MPLDAWLHNLGIYCHISACDDLDGASDGIISHISACNAAFDIASFRCQDGTDAGDTCLSNAQIQAVRLITSEYKPGVTIAGMDTFPKWPFLEGAPFQGPSNFGLLRQPSNPITGKEALLYSAGDQTVKFIVTRNPQFDAMTFDPQEWKDRLSVLGSIMDVTDVSLDGFLSKGGKIILIHGTADDLITPHNSIAYYQRQLSRYGQDRLDSFLRFYMIPGYGHGFGKFNAKYASLDALENWVENGRAPSGLIAVDGNPGANRSRPMCEWPAWPKFTGNPGTEGASTSYTCVKG